MSNDSNHSIPFGFETFTADILLPSGTVPPYHTFSIRRKGGDGCNVKVSKRLSRFPTRSEWSYRWRQYNIRGLTLIQRTTSWNSQRRIKVGLHKHGKGFTCHARHVRCGLYSMWCGLQQTTRLNLGRFTNLKSTDRGRHGHADYLTRPRLGQETCALDIGHFLAILIEKQAWCQTSERSLRKNTCDKRSKAR